MEDGAQAVDIDSGGSTGDAWSVERVNRELGEVIDEAGSRFGNYVVGEISDIGEYDYGTFFTLCDLETEDTISCIAWANARERFDNSLEEGATGVVRASVDFYAERGECQLVVQSYWPLGESERTEKLQQLRETLTEEGLLDDDRKQSLEPYPDCVGVVTSLSGSAREDVCTAIHDRSPRTDIKIHGASVQGDDAVSSLITAVGALEADPEVETIIVTRGGGAADTLWCFNAEPLVRAVADCTTPVVVAIGHEDDETLLEAVADRRAMTPTDAGVQSTSELTAVRTGVDAIGDRVTTAYDAVVETRLERLDTRIDGAVESLEADIRQHRTERRATLQRAADLEGRIDHAYAQLVDGRLRAVESHLDGLVREIEHEVETEAAATAAATSRIADLEARIDTAYGRRVERRLDGLESRIHRASDGYESRRQARKQEQSMRRLQIVVIALVVLLVLFGAAVVLLVL